MPSGTQRTKVLYGIGKKRGRVHRYTNWRWTLAVLFTVAVGLIPVLGVLRFDLWAGRHVVLGHEVGFIEVAKAFAFPFLAINIGIVLASRLIGRYLCGFVCPVGALARLSEWLRWRDRRGGRSWKRIGVMLVVSAVLAADTFMFWIDWRVFAEGSLTARAISAGLLVGMTLSIFGMTYLLGLRFCRELCPSGIYFAVLGPETSNGVQFANPEACTECKACEQVCPMDLEPRHLADEHVRPGAGLYPDGLSNHALCIRCGDCVNVCEGTTEGGPTPLVMGWLTGDDFGPDAERPGAAAGEPERVAR